MKNNDRMKVHQAHSFPPPEIFNCIQITVKIGPCSPVVFSIRISVCYYSLDLPLYFQTPVIT